MTRLRQLWLVTAVATVAILAGGYFLLVSPKSTEAAALREDAETQLQVNAQLESQIDMLNKQKKELPEQQGKLAKFARLIPANPALPALVRSLTDAADNAGVELLNVNPELPAFAAGVDEKTHQPIQTRVNAPNGETLVDIPVKLKVAGNFTEVKLFFAEIEELNRALHVTGFKMTGPDRKLRKTAGTTAVVDDYDLVVAEITAHVKMTKKATAPSAPTTTTSSDEAK